MTSDEPDRAIEAARAHAAAQRSEAARLQEELAILNARLGAARRAQEHLQRPATLVTETAPERVAGWVDRLRSRRSRP